MTFLLNNTYLMEFLFVQMLWWKYVYYNIESYLF